MAPPKIRVKACLTSLRKEEPFLFLLISTTIFVTSMTLPKPKEPVLPTIFMFDPS